MMKELTIAYTNPNQAYRLLEVFSAESTTHLHLMRQRTGNESEESLYSEFRSLQRTASEIPLEVTIERCS